MEEEPTKQPGGSVKPISRHRLDGDIIQVHKGISIYKTYASTYYFARIRDPRTKKYIVRSTKETGRLAARSVAMELADSVLRREPSIPKEYLFQHFSNLFLAEATKQSINGERSKHYGKTAKTYTRLFDKTFGQMDVRKIETNDWMKFLTTTRAEMKPATKAILCSTFRNVMKIARNSGVIKGVPETPIPKLQDNPRPFFRFHPLVSKEHDVYKKLLATAKTLVGDRPKGMTMITEELYDLILFVTHSFVRPTTTELYSIRHADIQVADNPRRLILTIRDGKTGFRIGNTMPVAVSVYERIKKRYPDAKPNDYIFLPQNQNRLTASKTIALWFNHALAVADIKHDPFTNQDHTLYSLRHTAICMRIILSEGRINMFNLAKNAGTSVEQIERFYARNLPLSAEMARNLQTFG